jgi:hypothetical protein
MADLQIVISKAWFQYRVTYLGCNFGTIDERQHSLSDILASMRLREIVKTD